LARLLGMGTDGRVVKRNYMDALVRLHYARVKQAAKDWDAMRLNYKT